MRGQPGRTLTEEDVEHYQRIVVAPKETMGLIEEIDEVIEEHGGWPIEEMQLGARGQTITLKSKLRSTQDRGQFLSHMCSTQMSCS